MDFNKVDKWIEDNYDSIVKDLSEIVAFPSVEGKPEEGAPFGKAVAGALAKGIEIAEKLGFETENAAYFGTADYGDVKSAGTEYMAVLGHIDVVPVCPEDWNSDPFTVTPVGEKYVGRGIIDDKGPMLSALYGGAALKAMGYEPRIPLRYIFGTNEETGMAGVAKYIETLPNPMGGFTPDANWPCVIGEKGICHFNLSGKWDNKGDDKPLSFVSFHSGTAANIVPAKAEAVFSVNEGAELSFPGAEGIEVALADDEIVINATGKAAHGSLPEVGDNALTKLLRYIKNLDFGPVGAKEFFNKITRLTMDDKSGSTMGLDGKDEVSETTASPNILHAEDGTGTLTTDMRFCVTHKPDKYDKLLADLAEKEGLVLGNGHAFAPLYVSADAPMIKGLMAAYRDVTGDMSEPLVIGGGTYAKAFPGMVAFGPEPNDGMGRCHEANEYITKKELLEGTKIYARAIYNITK